MVKGLLSFVTLLAFAGPLLALDVEKQVKIGNWQVIKAQTENDGLSCQALLSASNGSLLLFGSQRRNAVTPLVGLGSGYAKGSKTTVQFGAHEFAYHQPKPSGANRFSPVSDADDLKIIRVLLSNRRTKVAAEGKHGRMQLNARRVGEVLDFFEENCQISVK